MEYIRSYCVVNKIYHHFVHSTSIFSRLLVHVHMYVHTKFERNALNILSSYCVDVKIYGGGGNC